MEAIKYARLCLDVTTGMIIFQKLSINHYNMSLTMKTTTNTGKIRKFDGKVREESVEAILNISLSLKTFLRSIERLL